MDDTASIRIVANADGVAPGINTAKSGVEGLGASVAAASAQMRGSFATVSTSVQEMGIRIRETVGMVGEMREAMLGFGEALIAAFAVEKIADWTREMAEGAERTRHTAETFGMTVPQVQGLQAAATATGISIDTLTRGMGILDKNMVTAASGTGTASAAFKAIGVSANDGKTQMDTLLAIADKFSQMADGPKKVALAMELFGRSGKEMIPFLDQGAAGIERLDQVSQNYSAGILLATDANKELAEWLDQVNERGVALAESTNETKVGFQGVSNVMTDAFAPVLKEITDGVNSLIQAFIESYREGGIVATTFQIIADVVELGVAIFEVLADTVKALWELFTAAMAAIGELIRDVFGSQIPKGSEQSQDAFLAVRNAVVLFKDGLEVAVAVIKGLIATIVADLQMMGTITKDVLKLNWGAIAGDWQKGFDKLVAIVKDAAQQVKFQAASMSADIAAAGAGMSLGGGGGISAPKGGSSFDPDLTKAPKEKKPKKEKADPGDKDDSATTDLEEAKDSAKAKEAIAASNATTIEQLMKFSAEAQMAAVDKAEKSGVISKRTATAEKAAILATEVQAEVVAANTIYQAKVTELNAERDAEIASLVAKQVALDKDAKDYATKYQNLQNQIEAMQIKTNNQLNVLATQHENQLTVIKAKGVADREKEIAKGARDENKYYSQIVKDFGDNIAKMVTLQQSFMATLHKSWESLISVAQNAISSVVGGFLKGIEKQGLAATVAQEKQVFMNAKQAASGAWSAFTSMGPVGFALAPIAAATAFAATMAYSAEGGDWQVKPGLYQLHTDEMVLPAWAANPLRSMIAGNDNPAAGGSFGGRVPASLGSGGDQHQHYHYHDHTGTATPQSIAANEQALAKAIKSAHRNGRFANMSSRP